MLENEEFADFLLHYYDNIHIKQYISNAASEIYLREPVFTGKTPPYYNKLKSVICH